MNYDSNVTYTLNNNNRYTCTYVFILQVQIVQVAKPRQ